MRKIASISKKSDKKVGRPKKDRLSKLRTKAWFNSVVLESGKTAYELDIEFSERPWIKGKMYEKRPCIWDKYSKGEVEPRAKHREVKHLSTIQRVENVYPGTSKWITHPFWRVLSNTPIDMDELKSIYLSFSPPVRMLFVMENSNPKKSCLFWRRDTPIASLYRQLGKQGDLEAATAILALVKEAEISQNQKQHQLALPAWKVCQAKLKKNPVISPLIKEIDTVVLRKFLNTRYFYNDKYCRYLESDKGEFELVEVERNF